MPPFWAALSGLRERAAGQIVIETDWLALLCPRRIAFGDELRHEALLAPALLPSARRLGHGDDRLGQATLLGELLFSALQAISSLRM